MRHIPLWRMHLACLLVAMALAPWPARGADGFAACLDMFPGGAVPAQRAQHVKDLCKAVGGANIFAVRFDTARKIPVWTAHALSAAQLKQIRANAGQMTRPKFTPDAALPADAQAVDRSYVHSGFSRGHIVPANDMSWNKAAYDATFHFSNVVPQKQTFNAGTWLGGEDAFRNYVEDKRITLFNISGVYGTVEDDPATSAKEGPAIGAAPNDPTVPKCYYKIIVAPQDYGQPYKVLALLFAWNDFGRRATWVNAVTTLDVIRARSGVDVLGSLAVEADFDAAYWGVAMPGQPADCD